MGDPGRRVVIAAFVTCALRASIASAQVPPSPAVAVADPNVETARRHFEVGVAAMARGDFAEAVRAFEDSYRLRRTASVALNLGVSLHRLGRLVEARSRLQEYTATATPAQHAAHDVEAGRLLAEIGRRVGRVRVTELVPATASLTIDGRPAILDADREAVVDPGDHVVRARAPDMEPFDAHVTVAEGAVGSVRVVLHAPRSAAVDPRVSVPAEGAAARPITSRWWFWTAVGAVAVGATVGIVVAASGGSADPVPGGSTGRVLQGITSAGGASW